MEELNNVEYSQRKISWCDYKGLPSSSTFQKPLTVIKDIKDGIQKYSVQDLVFRNTDNFVARELHNHLDVWQTILLNYHKREEVQKYINHGVSVFDFMHHFKGSFKGKFYDSDKPPSMSFPNSPSCNNFEEFISTTVLERLHNGSLSIWGKHGACIPPRLVMPITIEPEKPRMCHDERFLNLWTKSPPIKFDPVTDLPRYVDKEHFQTKLDDKSGYDHVKITRDSREYFGLFWKG